MVRWQSKYVKSHLAKQGNAAAQTWTIKTLLLTRWYRCVPQTAQAGFFPMQRNTPMDRGMGERIADIQTAAPPTAFPISYKPFPFFA